MGRLSSPVNHAAKQRLQEPSQASSTSVPRTHRNEEEHLRAKKNAKEALTNLYKLTFSI
jgi:hypothetical protein